MVEHEGRGRVAPSPIQIKVQPADMRWLTEVAMRRDEHRGYSMSRDSWKRGMVSNPTLIGMVGEFAIERFLLRRGIASSFVDDRLNNGDGGVDGEIHGITYQVKTAQRLYSTCLVRRVNGRGVRPLVADRFIFACWKNGDAVCLLRGWCTKSDVRRYSSRIKSTRGEHHNLEMPACELSPMGRLILAIREDAHVER